MEGSNPSPGANYFFMTTIEIPEIGFLKEIPSSYDEMTTVDFIRFIKLWERVQTKLMDITRMKTEMVYHFLGLRHSNARWEQFSADDKEMISINVYQIAETLNFLFTQKEIEGKIHIGINLSWTKNHIPTYGGLYGPADLLADISWIEYKDALVAATAYIETEDIDNLHRLAAILYRKKSIWTRKKKSYDAEELPKNIRLVQNWPFHVLYGIFLFFLSCEKYIREGTFNVDNREISFTSLFSGGDESDNSPNAGLTGLMYNLAETGVFGNVKETARQNLYDILFRLWQVHNDYLKAKSKAEKK